MQLKALICTLACASAPALALDLDATQTGGLFADGGVNNSPAFQNYFVGYGTSPGLPRTAERRAFFVFELPALPEGSFIAGATLHLRLPFGGLIFGKGPGDPAAGPLPSDPFEAFMLTLTEIPAGLLLDPALAGPPVLTLFDMLAFSPLAADPLVFGLGAPLPTDPDGMGAPLSLSFSGPALAALNAKAGSTLVLGGWMPSWSADFRTPPGADPGEFVEGSELIFGLTDIHSGAVPSPWLELSIAAVPEPAPTALLLSGLGLLAWRRLRR